jgi:hypothetical protein
MYYHFAILLLFRPLIKLRIIGSSISPRDVCSQAADAISGLLRSYSQLYTLRRTPSFVPYFVLTSSIMHLAIAATSSPSSESAAGGADSVPDNSQSSQSSQQQPKTNPRVYEAITRGIADLTEMAPCHHFAEQALNILRFLAKKWNVDVETNPKAEEPGQFDPSGSHHGTRPVTSGLNFFAPNFLESDFNRNWGGGTASGTGFDQGPGTRPTGIPEVATAMENPLFWPFPMQGRPILPTGKALEEAGFEMIH